MIRKTILLIALVSISAIYPMASSLAVIHPLEDRTLWVSPEGDGVVTIPITMVDSTSATFSVDTSNFPAWLTYQAPRSLLIDQDFTDGDSVQIFVTATENGDIVTSSFKLLVYHILSAWSSEFQVNETSEGNQWFPQLLMPESEDNAVIVVWHGFTPDHTESHIYAKMYNALTQAPEFQVNTSGGHNLGTQVAEFSNEKYIVVWQHKQNNLSVVKGRIFSLYGSPQGPEFTIHADSARFQYAPDVTPLVNGNTFFCWTSYPYGGGDFNAEAIVLDSNQNVVTPVFNANSTILGVQGIARAITLNDGRVVVNWNSAGQDGHLNGVFATVFESDGSSINIPEFQVNSFTQGSQFQGKAVEIYSNRLFFYWESYHQDTSLNGVYGKTFDVSTNVAIEQVPEFRINDFTYKGQQSPGAARLDDVNRVFISWGGWGGPGAAPQELLYGKIINANDGSTVASEMLLVDPAYTGQGRPSVLGVGDDSVFLVYGTRNQDTPNSSGISGRILKFVVDNGDHDFNYEEEEQEEGGNEEEEQEQEGGNEESE